jgi:hypothetical protein
MTQPFVGYNSEEGSAIRRFLATLGMTGSVVGKKEEVAIRRIYFK